MGDRNKYITVHLDNVEDNFKSQFHVDPRADVQTGYDILSLMHYGAKAASTNGQNTMDTTAKGYAKYTTDPAEYYKYQLGNKLAGPKLTQISLYYYTRVKCQQPKPACFKATSA